MENQINVGNQNTQQIGQNLANQPVNIPEKPKANYLMIGGIILACFVVFGFGGYYLGKQSSDSPKLTYSDNTKITPSSEEQQTTSPSTPILTSVTSAFNMSNWIESGSRMHGFTIKHPKNVTYGDTSDNYARFVMFDESNPDQYSIKEIPGFEFRIKRVSYPTNQTLEQIVEKELENSREVGDVLKTSRTISIGDYSGFTYKSRGLGTHRYYFLTIDPKDYVYPNQKDYFYIINSSTDQNQSLVEKILSTLKNSKI